MNKTSVIITAGGIGKRMQTTLPKQFLLIKGIPVLMHTIERFYHFNPKFQIIITLPKEWLYYWDELIHKYNFSIPHRIVPGGEERYHSIQEALKFVTGDFVWIHDGVRPLVNDITMNNCRKALEKYPAVIPVVDLTDSLRKKTREGSIAVNRKEYCLVQTPQCFRTDIIQKAYRQPFHEKITDDASLVESMGIDIALVEGNAENIKITRQMDLSIAEVLL